MIEMRGWAKGQRWVRVRIFVIGALFSIILGSLIYRAWVLQVQQAQRFKEMAEDQYLREVELPARRGRVLDRNGTELAISAEVDSIYANPKQVQASGSVESVADALSRVLDVDRRDLAKRLSTRRYFAWLKRRVLPDEARGVRALALRGVYLTKEPRRYYPNRALAGPLIGWASLDGTGIEGLELHYDKELHGAPAEVQGLRDALGNDVFPSGIAGAQPRAGHDLVLTIDKFIQHRIERALEEGVARHHAKAASAIALDPRSGEIVAMAVVPSVNPNDPATAQLTSKERGVRNRAVTDPFEPGSTMKAFTMTGAFEAGVIKVDDRWYCENGHYAVGSAIIHDAEKIGNATTMEVLAQSSNICTAKIARKLGKAGLEEILRRMGFGAPTGVDLPGERAGVLRSSKRWGEIELATIAFGQGMTATQMQLAAGYAAIANGGMLLRPHLVRRILDEKGRTLREITPDGRRVIREETARTMRAMLHAVMQKGGTGEKLAIPGYPAGGKTGTAQKVDPLTHRYSPDKWMSSFIGFAPVEDARLVLVVSVDEPLGIHYGSSVAGPIWREVMIDALRYLNVTPSEALTEIGTSNEPSRPAEDVAASLPVLPVDAVGDEVQLDTEGLPEEAFADDGSAREVPDFTGLSVGEALELARRARLPVEIVGTGRAVGQSPGPGLIRAGARCRVSFAPSG